MRGKERLRERSRAGKGGAAKENVLARNEGPRASKPEWPRGCDGKQAAAMVSRRWQASSPAEERQRLWACGDSVSLRAGLQWLFHAGGEQADTGNSKQLDWPSGAINEQSEVVA